MKKDWSLKQYSDTNVNEVKRLNKESGLSYNEVLELLAKSYAEKHIKK